MGVSRTLAFALTGWRVSSVFQPLIDDFYPLTDNFGFLHSRCFRAEFKTLHIFLRKPYPCIKSFRVIGRPSFWGHFITSVLYPHLYYTNVDTSVKRLLKKFPLCPQSNLPTCPPSGCVIIVTEIVSCPHDAHGLKQTLLFSPPRCIMGVLGRGRCFPPGPQFTLTGYWGFFLPWAWILSSSFRNSSLVSDFSAMILIASRSIWDCLSVIRFTSLVFFSTALDLLSVYKYTRKSKYCQVLSS